MTGTSDAAVRDASSSGGKATSVGGKLSGTAPGQSAGGEVCLDARRVSHSMSVPGANWTIAPPTSGAMSWILTWQACQPGRQALSAAQTIEAGDGGGGDDSMTRQTEIRTAALFSLDTTRISC